VEKSHKVCIYPGYACNPFLAPKYLDFSIDSFHRMPNMQGRQKAVINCQDFSSAQGYHDCYKYALAINCLLYSAEADAFCCRWVDGNYLKATAVLNVLREEPAVGRGMIEYLRLSE
jgi:hypothetical protein